MRNRFKRLDLIDRVPDELWTEVRDIVQETGIKTIPMEMIQRSYLQNRKRLTDLENELRVARGKDGVKG